MSFSIPINVLQTAIDVVQSIPIKEGGLQLAGIVKVIRIQIRVPGTVSDYQIIKELAKKLTTDELGESKAQLLNAFQNWSELSKASHETRVAVRVAQQQLYHGDELSLPNWMIHVHEFFSTTIWGGRKGSEDEIHRLTKLEKDLIEKKDEFDSTEDQGLLIKNTLHRYLGL